MAGSFLACSTCFRRAAQAACRGSIPLADANTTTLRSGVGNALPLIQSTSRHYTTAAATTSIVDAPQTLSTQNVDPAVADKKNRDRLQRVVKKHLDHMEDPWKIAKYVEQTLARDRYDEALLLVQKASKDGQVVVAWNHLIDYQLGKQQLKQAIRLYNDMKKRGQLPNVQTFTIIFRGCAKSQHPKAAVAEAVKHYNILLKDTRLQPNSIHLNAVLNVCARAGDLDSMFLIADTVNESSRAPTTYTYTTILNALRHHAIKDLEGLSQEEQDANLQKMVDRAKGLWTEVMEKWRQARLVIDEELVCAMGRVLLMAPDRLEKREVLVLLEETMSIPNLAKAPNSDAFNDPKMLNIAMLGSSKPVLAVATHDLGSSKSGVRTKSVYAVPGRNTLALVLTTLASSRLTTCGIKYWNLMVRHYGIVPDSDNWLRMFGMLKVAKASAHSAAILEILPDEYVHPKPYQIAMETCVRDNINTNAIAHSNTILDSMLSRLPVPDLNTLRLYLRVALVSHFHLRAQAQNGDEAGAKRDYGIQITTALARLWEPYKKVHYHYFKASSAMPASTPSGSSATDKKNSTGSLYNNKREVIALARLMFSAFNKVINERMLPEKDLRELRPVGAKINREIQAFYSNRDELEPRLHHSSSSRNSSQTEAEFENDDGADAVNAGFRPGGDFVWDTTKTKETPLRNNNTNNYESRKRWT